MSSPLSEFDSWYMRRALELAARGQGLVEPNPMVGCVVVQDGEVIGEGWHRAFGGPHAEIEALAACQSRAAGATLYVTLEPCCHQGKTPPCTEAIIGAKLRRVVAAMSDPFPAVAGRGLAELSSTGMDVETGLLESEARQLNAPYLKLVEQGRPWIIAKWAMTLDGKIATRSGESRWISGEASRHAVHQLRGRVDAIIVGRATAEVDNPELVARPSGPRVATRIVVDSQARLPSISRLVQTARDVPVLVAASELAAATQCERLSSAGCEVFVCRGGTPQERLDALLAELGRRRMTNVLVEGGGKLLGSLFDAGQIDEAHVFIAPLLVGGQDASSPVGGAGVGQLAQALRLDEPRMRQCGDDVYLSGRIMRP